MTDGKLRIFIAVLLLEAGLFLLVITHSLYSRAGFRPALEMQAAMVRELGLTDLCLFTDARYTRHPAMADLNSAFQDYPMSFEHFPSGSLMPPPAHLVSNGLD